MNLKAKWTARIGTALIVAAVVVVAAAARWRSPQAPKTPSPAVAGVTFADGAVPATDILRVLPSPPRPLPAAWKALGSSIEVDAHDVVFARPLTVRVPFDPALAKDLPDQRLVLVKESRAGITHFRVPELKIDRARGLMTVQVRSC